MPRYWANEVTGRMKEIVLKFFQAQKLEDEEIKILKSYIMEWMNDSLIPINKRVVLEDELKSITDSIKLMEFNHNLLDYGIDPF